MAEGSLELKLPTIWTDEKQRWEESEKRREEKRREEKKKKKKTREEKEPEETARKKKMQVAKRSKKSREVRLLKRRARSHLARREWKKFTPLWREAHFEAKMYKITPFSEHLLKLGCGFAWQAQGILSDGMT